jgi:hypothetical protein
VHTGLANLDLHSWALSFAFLGHHGN